MSQFVKALPKGKTLLTGVIKTQAGELLPYAETLAPDASRLAFLFIQEIAHIPIPAFDDVFGKLGYSGPNQWRVYRHFAHHAARM